MLRRPFLHRQIDGAVVRHRRRGYAQRVDGHVDAVERLCARKIIYEFVEVGGYYRYVGAVKPGAVLFEIALEVETAGHLHARQRPELLHDVPLTPALAGIEAVVPLLFAGIVCRQPHRHIALKGVFEQRRRDTDAVLDALLLHDLKLFIAYRLHIQHHRQALARGVFLVLHHQPPGLGRGQPVYALHRVAGGIFAHAGDAERVGDKLAAHDVVALKIS